MSMAILADACTPMSSNIAQKDLVGQEGQYPIYGASGLIGFVNFYRQEQQYIAVVKDGAGIGRVFSLPPYSSVIGTMQYLLPKDGIDVGYLYYALQFMHLEKYYTGSTIPHIYFKDYKREPLNIPSNDRQREIAETLGLVDEAIDTLNAQITTLGDLVKSRFIEMFGDPVTNPHSWEVKKLKDICTVGSSKRVYQSEQTSSGVPFLRVSDLMSRITEQTETCDLYISEQKFNEFEQQGLVPKSGDILVTARGTLGQCYIVKPEDRFYFQDGMISWVHTSEAEINPIYLSYLFDSQGIAQQIDRVVSGTTVAYLSIAQLGNFDILLPSIALQNQFADFVALTDKSELVIRELLTKHQLMKEALMQEYFG